MIAQTPRHELRRLTAPDHERVDAAFSGFDLTTVPGYGGFLLAQSDAFLPLEAALDRSTVRDVLPDWPARRRSDQLRADLAELGLAPGDPSPAPISSSPAAQLGAVYVLEGSRLGGQLLARTIPVGVPRAFLDAGDGRLWRTLTEILDETLRTVEERATAAAAAKDAFLMFETSALRHASASNLG